MCSREATPIRWRPAQAYERGQFMDIITIVTGAILLLLGRPLFWLFVGIVGFLVGFDLAGLYLAGHWTQPGAGLQNVVVSGTMTANMVLSDLKKYNNYFI